MADTITVRTAVRADLAGVDSLLARAYPRLVAQDYPPSTRVLALPLLSRARPELLETGTYHVAEDSTGAIVGAGGWTFARPAGGVSALGIANVRHVVTDDRRVRQGIGRAIMTRVCEQASAAGVTTLDCLSTLTAVPFYAALGFRMVGPVTVPLRPGIDIEVVRMQRRL